MSGTSFSSLAAEDTLRAQRGGHGRKYVSKRQAMPASGRGRCLELQLSWRCGRHEGHTGITLVWSLAGGVSWEVSPPVTIVSCPASACSMARLLTKSCFHWDHLSSHDH